MDIDATFLLILLSLILPFFFILNRKSKSLNLPPGPPKLPIIGNLHQIAGSLPHHAFRDLAKKYGPIMHLKLGQIPTIIVSSPELAEQVLKTNDIALANRPYVLLADIILYKTSDIAFGPYGDYWRQMKKIVTIELLGAKKVQSFSSFREQEVDLLVQFIRSNCGKPVPIIENATRMINNITCKASFGNICKQQDALIDSVSSLIRLANGFHVADLFPEFQFLQVITGMKAKLTNIHKNLDEILEEIFSERKTKREASGASEDDLLDVLLTMKESGGLQFPIADNNIKAIFLNMFIGGTDTSASTIEWAMTEMIRNPNVMNKAQTEVREAFKGKKTITSVDLKDLAYLKLVIKETLRVHVPGPLLVPRECREHCQIGGYDIPVKTQVLINAYAIATDSQYWHDSKSFKPERFEKSLIEYSGRNYEYLPFGSGRRICPGTNFGLASVELALAQMLYFFNWQLPSGLDPRDIDMTENQGAVAVKKTPLQVIPTLYSSMI